MKKRTKTKRYRYLHFVKVAVLPLFFIIWAVACSAPKDVQYPGMKVRGRFLYTQKDERVILRGVNKMFVWQDIEGTTMKEIAKTGANCVRIVWLAKGDPKALDALIQICRDEDMIPMVELHDATGKWGKKLTQCVDYWVSPEVVQVIKKHEEYLLINIANEAGDASITSEDFQKRYSSAVIDMRAAGIHVPIIIDGVDWGKNIDIIQETGFEIIKADPDHNLMFSVHMWWPKMWGYSAARVKNELEECTKYNLPIIVGEFGNMWEDNKGGQIPYKEILAECQKNQIGWLAWSWGPGNNPQSWLDMTKDGTFSTLFGWGKEVALTDKNSIKGTALKPKSFGGNIKGGKIPGPEIWETNMNAMIEAEKKSTISGGSLQCLQAEKKVVVDGTLNEWKTSFLKENNAIHLSSENGYVNAGDISDKNDFSASVYASSDEKNLYLAAKVIDDSVVKKFPKKENWRNDGIEFWIDGAADKGTMPDFGGDDSDNFQLVVDAKGNVKVYRNKEAVALGKQCTAAAKEITNGYIVEVKIPLSAIQEFDVVKNKIGFNVSFVDADGDDWSHILWQGKKENNPKQWGTLAVTK